MEGTPKQGGGVVRDPNPGDNPDEITVITDAPMSYQDQLAARRRRYSIMMFMRVPCLVLAAVFYNTPWLAATLIILSIPLPWMAVIIANDRLPLKRTKFQRFRADAEQLEKPVERRQLDSGEGRIIDGG